MRRVIFDAFHGKCAYCEAQFELDQTGDVDHFRPKGGVTDAQDRPAMVSSTEGGPSTEHPGYYWLAYDWHNLLPSCGKSNPTTKLPSGVLVGKGTRFPVFGAWATRPDDVKAEKPLFLNPVVDHPGRHLNFDAQTGIVGWKTKRGRACVELLDLNRERLPEARRRAYKSVEAMLRTAIEDLENGATSDVLEWVAQLRDYRAGTTAYSWAGRRALRERSDLTQRLQEHFR
jgi:hypothetical protein